MLFLRLGVTQRGSKLVLRNRDLELDTIQQATRMSTLLRLERKLSNLNQTDPTDTIDVDVDVDARRLKDKSRASPKQLKSRKMVLTSDTTTMSTDTEIQIKRPRGRPRKTVSVLGENPELFGKFKDISTYLEYAASRKLKPTGTVFVGNLYELQVKEFLQKQFKIRRTIHQGGSHDKGIDINAIWEPTSVITRSRMTLNEMHEFEVVNHKRVKPIVKRTNKTLNLFVQCKCYNTAKIDPKLIREIKGTLQDYFRKHGNSAVFMLASTNGFTRAGMEDFDKANIPLMYAKFSKPRLLDSAQPFDIKSWKFGSPLGFYLNPLATGLFKGLDWIKFTKKISA